MKRIFCFILIFLLLIPSALADEQKMVFRLEEAKGNVGDTVTMNAVVEKAPTCASFRVIFTYDQEVLQPVSVKKEACGGLFMSNVNYTHQGKAAINVLAAHANKSFEGDATLFTVTFKILKESPETTGSPIKLAHQEFFDPSTPKPQPITPTVQMGVVFVGDDKPADPTPEAPDSGNTNPTDPAPEAPAPTPDPAPDTPVTNPDPTPDTPVTNPDVTPDAPSDAPAPETPTNPEAPSTNEDKKPTGSWIPDKDTDDLYHVDEQGNSTVFQPEYSEKPEPGKVTDVILKDKETGKEVGSLKVEGNEDGSFDVIEQDVPSLNKPEEAPALPESDTSAENEVEEPGVNPDGISIWVWVGIGAGTLALAGIAIWVFYTYRKLK